MTAREEILGRIRAALSGAVESPVAAVDNYKRKGRLDHEACVELLRDRLRDYDAEIFEAGTEAEIAGCVSTALRLAGETRVVVAEGIPATWLPEGVTVVVDRQLPIEELEGITTVVTPCETAVAATGTLVLVHAGSQGRRAMTLLPDHHICVVRRAQVVEVLPEALEALAGKARAAITTISGPSATSDIEMTRIRGVHGPRRLSVVLAG